MIDVSRTVRLALALVLLSTPLSAQSISLGLRGTGSFPTGDFAEDQTAANDALIQGAKQGFGYGAEVGIGFGPIGAYGSFDHIAFDCETCAAEGEYTLQGVTVGLKLRAPSVSRVRPFVKGGVTFNHLKGEYGGTSSGGLSTDRQPGYELGIGADLGILGLVSIQPQLRYVGQNFKGKIPGVTNNATAPESGVNYFTFDLGLAFGR